MPNPKLFLMGCLVTASAGASVPACETVARTQQAMEIFSANIANAHTTRTAEGGFYKPKKLRCDSHGCEVTEDDEPRLVYLPDHPDADDFGYVRYPNIDPAKEMTKLMAAERKHRAARKDCPEK